MRIKKIFICTFIFFISSFSACASEQIRVAVMPFLTRTSEINKTQAGKITEVIIKFLQASQSISVIERERIGILLSEQGFNAESFSGEDAAEMGRIAGCKYILLGSVTEFSQKYLNKIVQPGFLDFNFNRDEQKQEANITLEARLIDTTTGQIIFSFNQRGSALISSKDKNKNNRTKEILTGYAVEAVATRLCDKVREIIANEYALIALINENKNIIRINRGSISGVKIGAFYKVYQDGEKIFDLDGKLLGKKYINLALIRVIDVQNNFSTVEIISDYELQNLKINPQKAKRNKNKNNSGNELYISKFIKEGDKIEAVSFSEAEEMKFSSERI